MSRRSHAVPLFVVVLLVVAACGVSFAQAADAGADVCGAAKGWGPAKSETGHASTLLLELAAIPVGLVQGAPTITSCVAQPERLEVVVDHGPAQPRAPRAPPLA
ncbi:MAG: hypothetical protein HY727_15430 [Candidatus Rokubacteria bacterium]|nr:hypothetical protein [Candidatus Rokubacteria bacterium]